MTKWGAPLGAPAECVPCPSLQVSMLGFAGALQWQKAPGKGLLVKLPPLPPSPLSTQPGWALRLQGVQ